MSHGRSHALPLPSTRLRACPHAPQAGRAVAPRPPPLVRLGDVCEIVSGSTPKTSVESYWGGSFPWITPAELNDKTVVVGDTARHLSEEGVASAALKPFPAGTVLLSSRAPIGKVAIAGCDMYCNQGFKNLICSDAIHNFYLYYWLKSHTSFLNSLGRGATFKEISKAIVAQIQIPLPPLPEQKRIAAILDKICEMKRNAEARLQKLDLLVKARFVEMFGDARLNDKAWTILNFSNICRVRQGLQIPISDRLAIPEDNCFEYITIAYLHGTKKREYIRNPKPSVVCHKDDVLMTRTGNTGLVVSNVEGVFHNNFFLIDFDKSRFERLFIIHYLNSTFIQGMIQKYAGISTIPDLNHGDFYRMPIFEPPLALQRQFAAFVEKVEGLKATAKKELEQVDLLYRAKLQEFFG